MVIRNLGYFFLQFMFGVKNFIKRITPFAILSLWHFLLASFSAFWHGYPSHRLFVIGVTGTKGKSTIVNFLGRILEESGERVGWSSSISFKVGDKEWANNIRNTMPGRFFIQKLLSRMAEAACRYAILEVTSEGVRQFRHKGIEFDMVIFTGLAPEHIESHGSFEKYRAAKEKLFDGLAKQKSKKHRKAMIVNSGDENAKYFVRYPADVKIGYSLGPPRDDVKYDLDDNLAAEKIEVSPRGSRFFVGNEEFVLKVSGDFNVSNAAGALAAARLLNVPAEVSKRALEKIKFLPGRMEFIDEGQNFPVVVDYAHMPDALEKVYKTLRRDLSGKKLICVLGSQGGGRDKWKRAEMGRIAGRFCDFSVITNEDPYDDNAAEIIDDIEKGFLEGKKVLARDYEKILDRREAIKRALVMAGQGDTVAITGKGCEISMIIKGEKIPWDEREIIKEEIRKIIPNV